LPGGPFQPFGRRQAVAAGGAVAARQAEQQSPFIAGLRLIGMGGHHGIAAADRLLQRLHADPLQAGIRARPPRALLGHRFADASSQLQAQAKAQAGQTHSPGRKKDRKTHPAQ
jgi:hypothetical protein